MNKINNAQYYVLACLLVLQMILLGCAGQPEQAQSLAVSPQTATTQPARAVSTATPSPLSITVPALTDTPSPTVTSSPVAPTATPSQTPLPTTAPAVSNSYQISYVTEDDILNVRAGPGINFEIVDGLAPDAADVLISSDQNDAEWVEISRQDINGWVNRYYLTAMVDPQAFCNDSAAQALVDTFQSALESRDSTKLASLIHPRRGLLVRINWWNNEVNYTHQEVTSLFGAGEVQDWGYEDGSGASIEGDFLTVIVPILDKDFAGTPQLHCNDLAAGGSAGIIQLPFEYQAVNYYAVHRPPQDNEFDWGTWVVGVEYWGGKPYVSFLVHYQWEI